jgi:hypothetical protein
MVTTLGDLRRESKARAGNLYSDMPRRQSFARFDDVDTRLPHEILGILVAQALDWDAQRIAEAFTVALKRASEQGSMTWDRASGGDVDHTARAADKQLESALTPAYEQVTRNSSSTPDEGKASENSPTRLDVQSVITDQLSKATDESSSQSIAEVRQQFITLGELVLEAIGAVDRSGHEAVG